MNGEDLLQVFLASFSSIAIWLSWDPQPRVRKWAPVIGLCGQPFWFLQAWEAGQWGAFVAAIAFTVSWFRGLRSEWAAPASAPNALCEGCHGSGEYFTHDRTCDDPLCALNGDVHSCAGQVVECDCVAKRKPS